MARTQIQLTEKQGKRALEIFGRYGSGKHEISKEHDKYLAETFDGK